MIKIFNGDCVDNKKRIEDESVDLGIFDPPFGIGESKFDKHYNRKSTNVIKGYVEAPKDYGSWTNEWMSEAKRVLKPNGSMYIIIGNTNLRHILNAANDLGLYEINHIVWKYNFGVYTYKKYVTSHYHILYYSKLEKSKVIFNTNCRFGSQEKDEDGKSLVYKDLEDVFIINKEYAPKQKKNQNKLPEELINKIILYSSNQGDMVCDFFMGNFTTAYCSTKLGRNVCGYEMNMNSYNYHIDKIKDVKFGCELLNLKKVKNIAPKNQRKKISQDDIDSISYDYNSMLKQNMKKCDISLALQTKYGRGRFSIKNILEKYVKNSTGGRV